MLVLTPESSSQNSCFGASLVTKFGGKPAPVWKLLCLDRNESLAIQWGHLNPAPDSILEFVSSSCKKSQCATNHCNCTAVNLLSANPTKWSNTDKQFVGKLPTNCLSVFDHFVKLALKGLICHVRIYIAAPIVRTKIVKKKLTLMRMMMILVNIKMETLMEKQMTPVIVVKMNSLKIMK